MEKFNFDGTPSEQPTTPEQEKAQKKQEYIALAKELSEHHEGFPFPGLTEKAYSTIKADQDEYPGYSTPIDELIEKFTTQGMKVVLGNHPDSGNIFVLPLNSNDVENDSLFPRHLAITGDMDDAVKTLITKNQI